MIDPTDGAELSSLRGGRYSVVGLIGSGAQGSTLLAVEEGTGRHVAIKRFVVKGARSWKDVELAEREASVLASLSHPRLPAYYEHFEEGGALYLVMERIEGAPLFGPRGSNTTDGAPPSRALARMDEAEVVRMIREVGEVLAYLHGRAPPVVHRDVKPGNVLRRPDGSFVLIDFGAVRDRLRPEGGSTVVGTFGFMAPEQFQGRAGPGSDVYSLGATALAVLTGREPEDLPHKGLALDVAAAIGGPGRAPLVALLEAMLAPDPDVRATSVAPLLARYDAARASGAPRSQASPPREVRPSDRPTAAAPGAPASGSTPPVDPVLGELEQTIEAGVKALEEGIESGARELQRFLAKTVAEAKAREAEERTLSKGQRKLRKRDERRAREAARRERKAARAAGVEARAKPAPPVAAFFLLLAEIVVTVAVGVAVPLVLSLLAIVFGPGLRAASRKVEQANARAVAAIRRARLGDQAEPKLRVSTPNAPPGERDGAAEGDAAEADVAERAARERDAEDEAEADERARRDEARRRTEDRRRG